MKTSFKDLYHIISNSDRRVYYIGKKSTFMFCFVTVLAYFFPTTHNGDLVDVIWSNLYWAGPLLAVISFTMMLLAAYKEHKSGSSIL